MTSDTSTSRPHDRIVLQASDERAEAAIRSLLSGPAPFIHAGATRDAILAAIEAATDLVLCEPRHVHQRTQRPDEMQRLTRSLPETLPDLRVGLVRLAATEPTEPRARTPRRFRFTSWAPGERDWGSCRIDWTSPGVVPSSGLTIVTAPDGWPLLAALLRRRGFDDPIRLGADEPGTDAGLNQVCDQLATTLAAMVHLVPGSTAGTARILEALSDRAAEARVLRTVIELA